MLGHLIKQSDMIAPQPSWYIKRNTRFKTSIGGLLTILLGFLSVLCFIGFGLDLFERQRPTTYSTKQLLLNNTIYRNQVEFVLAPMFLRGRPINDIGKKMQLFLEVINTDNDRSMETISKMYNLVPCNASQSEVFVTNYNNLTSNFFGDPNKYYCLPSNATDDIVGKFGNSQYITYDFHVGYCRGPQDNVTCNTIDQVQMELKMFYIHFLYLDYFIDLTDNLNPFKEIWNSDLIQVSANAKRSDEYYYKMVNINSDNGWVLEDFSEAQIYQFDNKISVSAGYDGVDMFECKVSISNLNDIHTRKYVKLQEIFANTGGFIKFLLMFMSIMAEFYSDRQLLNFILQETIKKEGFYNDLVNPEAMPITKNIPKISLNKSIDLSKPDTPVNIHSNQKETLKLDSNEMGIKNYFYWCSRTNSKNIVLSNLNRLYMKKLDILQIIKMSFVNKLTEKILFTENGTFCLKYLFYHDMFNKITTDVKPSILSKRDSSLLKKLKNFLKDKSKPGELCYWKSFLNEFSMEIPQEDNLFLKLK
jgi:archaellin